MKNFPYSESELLEIASRFKKHLKVHFDAIKSVNPELDQDFIFRFKALYYEAQSHSVLQEDNLDQVFSLELKEFGDQVRNLFPIFRFYMIKAFPYNSTLWESYGYCELEKVILDFGSLRHCLEGSVKLITDKRAELKAANCPGPTLDEILRLSKKIGEVHEEILEYTEKKEIKCSCSENCLNELFKLMEIVHNTASQYYQNDPESLKYLTFPASEQMQPK